MSGRLMESLLPASDPGFLEYIKIQDFRTPGEAHRGSVSV